MKQSTRQSPAHIGIIMDGNGRWAEARGLARIRGHLAGAEAVRRTVTAAAERGLPCLTLYAFSCENWRRPRPEVDALMALFGRYLAAESIECARKGVRLSVVGRRDRLPAGLVTEITRAEQVTSRGESLLLRVAVDYSARDSALRAAEHLVQARRRSMVTLRTFEEALAAATHAAAGGPPIDLLIRTGGELRLSDQMAWEAAYAELLFLEKMWPDFGAADLEAACVEYGRRQRRFGALPKAG
jgi:undecaprenyl diphosphate synthase